MASFEKNQEKQQNFQKAWAKIIAKAWKDQSFKERLLKNPMEVFKENGVELPTGMQCKINESSDKVLYLTLPKKPSGEIAEETLQKIAAGQQSTVDCNFC